MASTSLDALLSRLRIPDEAAHDSGMMPPAVPI